MLLQEILGFRLSETAFGAFSGTVSVFFIKRLREKLLSTEVVETEIEGLFVATVSQKGGEILSRGISAAPHPPK